MNEPVIYYNLLKFLLVKKHVDWNVFLRFGLQAIVLALIGSSVLLYTSHLPVLKTYQMFGKTCRIEPMKLIIALLLITFTLMDFIPKLKKMHYSCECNCNYLSDKSKTHFEICKKEQQWYQWGNINENML
jgi:hypothetical protein